MANRVISILFLSSYSPVLDQLRMSGFDCHIKAMYKGALSYADDITIMCPSFGGLNPIRSGVGGGGALKAPSLRFLALTHLILELHYCALGTFPKNSLTACGKFFF